MIYYLPRVEGLHSLEGEGGGGPNSYKGTNTVVPYRVLYVQFNPSKYLRIHNTDTQLATHTSIRKCKDDLHVPYLNLSTL
jgi:hypothetical protein